VLDAEGLLIGVVTRRDLVDNSRSGDELLGEIVSREPAVVFEDNTLRDAADHMVLERVGRLPVVSRDNPRMLVGIISRSDLLSAHAPRLAATLDIKRSRGWRD
jgi:CBS domain-containing protein